MKQFFDQVVGALAQAVRYCVVVLRYPRVGLLQGGRLKGRGPDKQGIHATPESPNIRWEPMALLVEHLRGNIIRRPADRSLLLLTKSGRQTKVTDLDSHAGSEEKVAKLQVPVDDVLLVDVGHPLAQLRHVVAHLGLRHRHPRLLNVHQRLEGAVLQHDVDVLRVFKVFEELDDISVGETRVELNLP